MYIDHVHRNNDHVTEWNEYNIKMKQRSINLCNSLDYLHIAIAIILTITASNNNIFLPLLEYIAERPSSCALSHLSTHACVCRFVCIEHAHMLHYLRFITPPPKKSMVLADFLIWNWQDLVLFSGIFTYYSCMTYFCWNASRTKHKTRKTQNLRYETNWDLSFKLPIYTIKSLWFKKFFTWYIYQ